MDIPLEIVNMILIMRPTHPIAKLFVCKHCGDNYNWSYARKYKNDLLVYTDFFEIVCECCSHELSKD